MNALGIAGSPRHDGNSTTLLRAVLAGAEAAGACTQVIHLNDLTYRGCQGCERCTGGGQCILKDALRPVVGALSLADIWVLAAPMYYDGVSGQFKTFFDRLRCLTRQPGRSGRLQPQLVGERRAAIIVTYEDAPRRDYQRAAEVFADYLSWMGDFDKVRVMSEGRLGPAGAAARKPVLLKRARSIGEKLARELAALGRKRR